MLNFVKRAFRSLYGILLWINLAVWVIGGGAGGYFGGDALSTFGVFDGGSSAVGVVVGLIAGAVVGLFTNIFVGGFVATFLEIGSDITDVKADVASIKGFAADIRTSTAETAAVFQKMANRGAPGGNMQ